jgi:hypothetical protein
MYIAITQLVHNIDIKNAQLMYVAKLINTDWYNINTISSLL